jgi:hypothetical protein
VLIKAKIFFQGEVIFRSIVDKPYLYSTLFFNGNDFIRWIIAASFTIEDEIKSGTLSSQTAEFLELKAFFARRSATSLPSRGQC